MLENDQIVVLLDDLAYIHHYSASTNPITAFPSVLLKF